MNSATVEKFNSLGSNSEAKKTFALEYFIRAMERFESGPKPSQGNSKNFGPGIYNQRRTKFECSCGKCGQFIDQGTLCWVTVGDSPRCLDCGRPEIEEAV